MTNVRRPIHLQLRPGATLGHNGAAPPFSLNSPTAVGSPAGVLLPGDLPVSRRVSPASHAAPIRPNALMNFSRSILTATPTTRIREPPMGRQVSRRRLQQPAGGLASPANTQFISSPAQQQQSPKALSPSGSLNDALPSQILPHLYVGNQEQTNRETVNKLNIKYILSLGLLPQLLQNANYTASSTSPGSPSKSTSLGSPTSATTTTSPMENTANMNSTSSVTNVANTHAAHHHHNHQQQQQPNHNLQYLTHQQQILMPGRDSSRDFKIRLRSSTPNSNAGLSLGATQLVSGCGGSSGTPAGLTQQQAASSPSDLYYRQAFFVGAAAASSANQDRSTAARATTTTAPPITSGTLDEVEQEAEVDDENKGVKQVRSIHCKCINISDNSDQSLLKFFDEAFAFIDEARRKKCNILVHCLAGISRSPTIAIGYLMRVKSLHWREAYDLVKQCRPQIDPNLNFMGQLRIYQRSLKNDEHELDERVNY